MKFLKQIGFFFVLLVILWVAHHTAVYVHEWTHGTVAWLAGYKNSPFAIHYGTEWFTLWDIDEAVPYEQILADGKPEVAAAIAIAPVLLQAILFLVGLKLLQISSLNRWTFAFLYWFTLNEICDIYAYIPIRTFINHGDIHNFASAMGISSWIVAIPGTLFVAWGVYRMLSIEEPRACSILKINSQAGQWLFLLANILLIFGYYVGVGFLEPHPDRLSLVSWILVPFALIYFWRKQNLPLRK
jgi:hypothetical protein